MQVRGLPHTHIIYKTTDEYAPVVAAIIDAHVQAIMPDPDRTPLLYDIVNNLHLHKGCNEKTPPMACARGPGRRCAKYFPKPESLATTFDERGMPVYKRGPNDVHVVAYCIYLLYYFHAHINVEVT
jgi:hypothetical protein